MEIQEYILAGLLGFQAFPHVRCHEELQDMGFSRTQRLQARLKYNLYPMKSFEQLIGKADHVCRVLPPQAHP